MSDHIHTKYNDCCGSNANYSGQKCVHKSQILVVKHVIFSNPMQNYCVKLLKLVSVKKKCKKNANFLDYLENLGHLDHLDHL